MVAVMIKNCGRCSCTLVNFFPLPLPFSLLFFSLVVLCNENKETYDLVLQIIINVSRENLRNDILLINRTLLSLRSLTAVGAIQRVAILAEVEW